MVAPRSAPHSSSAAMIVRARPWRRCSGSTSMPRKPTQSSAYAARPCATPGTAAVAVAAVDRQRRRRSGRRTAAPVVRTPPTPAGTACRRRGSPAPTRDSCRNERSVRLAQHRRHRRLPEPRVVPLHLGHRRNVIRIVAQATDSYDVPAGPRGRPAPSWRGGRWRWPRSGAASRRGPGAASPRGRGTARTPRTWASRGETRSRGDGRGGTGLPETMSAIAMVTGAARSSGATTHTPSPHAVQIPSTSVIAGPPDGPVSPGQHPPDHDARPDDVRAQGLGLGGRRHAQRLGWARPLTRSHLRLRNRRNW